MWEIPVDIYMKRGLAGSAGRAQNSISEVMGSSSTLGVLETTKKKFFLIHSGEDVKDAIGYVCLEFRRDGWLGDTLGISSVLCDLDPWGRDAITQEEGQGFMNSNTKPCRTEGGASRRE